MEAKKIAIACFVSGVLCVTVALICTPMFWWLGLLAGIAGGYLTYEFREVPRAIPIAWRKSYAWWSGVDERVRKLSFRKLDFPSNLLIITTFLLFSGMIITITWFVVPNPDWNFRLADMVLNFFTIFIIFSLAFFLASFVLVLFLAFALLGARVGEKCFWRPSSFSFFTTEEQKDTIEELKKKGYCEKELTSMNFLRWFVKGIVLCVLLGLKYFFVGILSSLYFLWKFGRELFKLIHSKERVLCAIDGTLGGTIAFFCFASVLTSSTFLQQMLVVFFGGLLGATIGVLNYEIVSKRILHLVPVMNSA